MFFWLLCFLGGTWEKGLCTSWVVFCFRRAGSFLQIFFFFFSWRGARFVCARQVRYVMRGCDTERKMQGRFYATVVLL